MNEPIPLQAFLDRWSTDAPQRAAVARTIAVIADVCAELSAVIAEGPLAGQLGRQVGDVGGGDVQKELDVRADQMFEQALHAAPVAVYGSEERREAILLDAGAPLAVAIDPLDGSSNIDTNVPLGSIFGVHAVAGATDDALLASVLRPGREQLAAGFAIYGQHTALVLTLGAGTHVFTLDRGTPAFRLTCRDVRIPEGRREYAINASNYRHWDEAIRTFVDDCMAGIDGPRCGNFNMRWIASLVAEAFRILGRGGIFLYPNDKRPGYQQGRLRLVYEANPIALIVEQAGGGATNGETRILDMAPRALHERVPLVFGSADKVARVARHYTWPPSTSERSPLFAQRGLFHHA